MPSVRRHLPDVVPDLTVGEDNDQDALEEAAKKVSLGLPVAAPIDRVWIMQGTSAPGSRTLVEELALASAL